MLARGWRAVAVKQHGIALELGDRQAERIGIGQEFQQFLDDVLAVLDFGFGDEFRETATMGNEERKWVCRCRDGNCLPPCEGRAGVTSGGAVRRVVLGGWVAVLWRVVP